MPGSHLPSLSLTLFRPLPSSPFLRQALAAIYTLVRLKPARSVSPGALWRHRLPCARWNPALAAHRGAASPRTPVLRMRTLKLRSTDFPEADLSVVAATLPRRSGWTRDRHDAAMAFSGTPLVHPDDTEAWLPPCQCTVRASPGSGSRRLGARVFLAAPGRPALAAGLTQFPVQ